MYSPISDDDRPSGRRHSVRSRNGSMGAGSVRNGVKGAVPRRRSSAATTHNSVLKVKRKRSPAKEKDAKPPLNTFDRLATYMVERQIKFSLIILSCFAAIHVLLPQYRSTTTKLFKISYHNPDTNLYGKGEDDIYFLSFWIVMFTFLRATAMDYIFTPLARRGGISTKRGLIRFAEQAWLLVYYSVFWTLGMYLMYDSPYWLNLPEMWTNWPLRDLGGTFKWYYLVQFAFWLQQIFVLNIEERRKDYYQMFAHHIITCTLMFTSYTLHMTRVGNVILCVMDVVDTLLPLAKMLKYLGYSTICDWAFGVFLITWFIGRHICYMLVVNSAWRDALVMIPEGCYHPGSVTQTPMPDIIQDWSLLIRQFYYPTEAVCFTKPILMGFIFLLLALQVLTLMWFYMIIGVAVKVIKGGQAEDTRSDDEDSEEEKEEEEEEDLIEEAPVKAVDSAQMTGTAMSTASLPSVIMNGGSRRHLSAQPLGGG